MFHQGLLNIAEPNSAIKARISYTTLQPLFPESKVSENPSVSPQ
jgi:hypothetical protein